VAYRIDELATVNIASRALEKMVCPDDFCKAGFNGNGGGGAYEGSEQIVVWIKEYCLPGMVQRRDTADHTKMADIETRRERK
jgi:hypothetical protein